MTTTLAKPKSLSMLIGGKWAAGSGRPRTILNPATEEVIAECPDADGQDVDRAVAAAHESFE